MPKDQVDFRIWLHSWKVSLIAGLVLTSCVGMLEHLFPSGPEQLTRSAFLCLSLVIGVLWKFAGLIIDFVDPMGAYDCAVRRDELRKKRVTETVTDSWCTTFWRVLEWKLLSKESP